MSLVQSPHRLLLAIGCITMLALPVWGVSDEHTGGGPEHLPAVEANSEEAIRSIGYIIAGNTLKGFHPTLGSLLQGYVEEIQSLEKDYSFYATEAFRVFCGLYILIFFVNSVFGDLMPPLKMAVNAGGEVTQLTIGSVSLPLSMLTSAQQMSSIFESHVDLSNVVGSLSLVGTAHAATNVAEASATFEAAVGAILGGFLSFLVYTAVFLLSQSIECLIMLSPLAIVDSLLRSIRGAVLLIFSSLLAWSPWVGLGVSIFIVGIAVWALTFTIPAFLFMVDRIVTLVYAPKRAYDKLPDRSLPCFAWIGLTREIKTPFLQRGWIVLEPDGTATFTWRKYSFLWRRRGSLTIDPATVALDVGVFSTALTASPEGKTVSYVILTGRDRNNVSAAAEHLGVTNVRESHLKKGLRSGIRFLWDVVAAIFGRLSSRASDA